MQPDCRVSRPTRYFMSLFLPYSKITKDIARQSTDRDFSAHPVENQIPC